MAADCLPEQKGDEETPEPRTDPGAAATANQSGEPTKLTEKPALVIAALAAALASAAFAGVALKCSADANSRQEKAADRQAQFERDVEERQSAPLLVPGVEPNERRRTITYPLIKEAGRLMISKENGPPRMVIPMRNVGAGAAIGFLEYAHVLSNCKQAPALLEPPQGGLRGLGYYVVRPGESEQLYYIAPRRLPQLRSEYRRAAGSLDVNVLVRYTDFRGRRLRWTCVRYTRERSAGAWLVASVAYGDRKLP